MDGGLCVLNCIVHPVNRDYEVGAAETYLLVSIMGIL